MTQLREVFLCRCGASVDRQTDVYLNDAHQFTATICDGCRAKSDVELAELRVEFEALLARGIDRRMANRIMIQRIDRRFADGTYKKAGER